MASTSEAMRARRLELALEAAEALGRAEGLYGLSEAAGSGIMAIMVGNPQGAAHRAADAAECIAELVELGEYEAWGAEYMVGLEAWRASNAVLAAAGGRA